MTQVIIKCAATAADITNSDDRLKIAGIGQHLAKQIRDLKELFRMIDFGVFVLEYSCVQNPGLNEVLEDFDEASRNLLKRYKSDGFLYRD